MGRGTKAFIEALLRKQNKEWHTTIFRIYYSASVYEAPTCILHSKTNTVLLAFSAKLFFWAELITNNMFEEISRQFNLIVLL